ncbi:MAG: DUF4430 domain-containing protein [Acetobacter sp.]|nr:DUF4430 domain-containing protein [Bacteroides sp.]MCM1341826.1 DUF4430 domain-containing protein [Acetobacter sp.]MCM1433992.1 DUF4430 domain-containing protein [Clostridiales bacterium]
MKKRLLSLLLSVLMITSILPAIPVFASTAWDGSTKTEPIQTDNVYQIGSGAELAWFAEESKTSSNISAVLTDDIYLGENEWTPIGLSASGYPADAFTGTFDGQGHTISGLSINTSNAFYGLFYCVYGGTVKNLSVIGNVSTTGNTAGGIVGKVQGGSVENCSFSGSVTAKGNYVGGIVGNIVSNSKVASSITGCYNAGEINGRYAGGILGYTTAKTVISSCYNTGTINGTTRSAGISGQQTTGSISYCYNIGNSSSGICGFSNAVITNCYYLNDETTVPGGSASGYEKITDTASLLSNLNADDNKLFTEDTKNKNNGYPVFIWQNKLTPEEEAAEQKKKENLEKVKRAVEELTLDTLTVKESCTLKLPLEINECSVSWSSSNTDIISNNGVVTLPDKNISVVTLTAEITCGEAIETKSFDINVWSEDIDADIYLQEILNSMEYNFKSLQPVYEQDTNIIFKFQQILKNKGYDGVTVTINSTEDENLISKNGKINYPINSDNSYADGKQVQVFFNLTFNDKTVIYPTTNIYSLLVPWDTSNVKKSLESSADTVLSEETVCGENESLNSVSSSLNLPSCIRGDKYSFAWINWTSSDEKHLAISDENRQGSADAIYNAYTGNIYRDSTEHIVTLTANITNPSTNVTIAKEFEITINPLSNEEIDQSLDAMNKILACYTADKLTNSATKEKLNPSAVDNDIQLIIPSKVVTAEELAELNYGKYWDYWNYKFSVTSSDTDVIEINSFRAYVYRPLGENNTADKQVTLTIKIESKTNPNLFAAKDITVNVKHLSRAEINAALDLMDQAKTNYANGLLGNNADTYSIIDNLTPYKQIVWNNDKSGVDFIYRHSDIQGNGVIVDELPDWEEQEDWRLFRTSDKDLISNETLILNQTPDEDTFVKINSVLTDETLGKYYTKFINANNYDAEALAKFKQLYKQPVSAYVMAVGAGNYTDSFAVMPSSNKASAYSAKLALFKKKLDKPISVTFTLLGLDGTTMISKTTENSFTKGATVFEVFKKLLADNNMYYTAKGSYVSSVNGLAEKDYGGNSGWMYTVGKVFVNSYMNAQELSGGEDIVVMYVRDYTQANVFNNSSDSNQNKPDNDNSSNNTNNANSDNSNTDKGETANQNNNSNNSSAAADNKNNIAVNEKTSSASDKNNQTQSDNEKTTISNSAGDNTEKKAETKTTAEEKEEDKSNSTENNSSNSEEGNRGSETDKNSDKNNNKKGIIILSCIACAILLALILLLILLKKNKKKE